MSFDRRLQWLARVSLASLVGAGVGSATARRKPRAPRSRGTVQDAQGGVLPGVTVTLTSRTQGNALTAVDRYRRTLRLHHRPARHVHAAGSLQGFKTARADQRRRQRQRPPLDRRLTMEVGEMTEEVTVSSRVSELQTTNGERSFALDNEALKNIANNGRSLFNFAPLVPGALPQGCAAPKSGGRRLHRQRPAAELQQHDHRRRRQHRHRQQRRQHGHDQHRRGRRVQGPDQRLPGRVRPRGRRPAPGRHQERHAGSSTGRATGTAGAPTGTPTRGPTSARRPPIPPSPRPTSRDDERLHHRRPVFIPGSSTKTRGSCSSSSARSGRRRTDPVTERPAACRRRSSARATSRRASTTSGNPFPYIRDYTTGLPCSADQHARAASSTAACSAGSRQPHLPAGPQRPRHLPARQPRRGSGLNYASQAPNENAEA